MPVHVSIHDVSPANEAEVEAALEMTDEVGVKPALLVVPNFHGAWPLTEHPSYCARLRRLQEEGNEIYLHGFFHAARMGRDAESDTTLPTRKDGDKTARSLRWKVAQHVVSGGEAEFQDVTQEEARSRLADGFEMFREVGLAVDGFVAPAWAMPRWLVPMLREHGVRFTEDHLRIYDPSSRQSRVSVVLNFASRSPARLFSTVAYCRVAKFARAAFPARFAIHPKDMQFALLRHETRALLDWGRGDFVQRGHDLFLS